MNIARRSVAAAVVALLSISTVACSAQGSVNGEGAGVEIEGGGEGEGGEGEGGEGEGDY